MTRSRLGWVPLVVVALVVAAAAWLGVSMQPSPSVTMAQIMAATRAAGTAHFAGTVSTHSTGRYSNSTSTVVGEIDLRHHAEQETDTEQSWETTSTDSGPLKTSLDRQTSRSIEIGDKSYEALPLFGGPGWEEVSQPRLTSEGWLGTIDPLLPTKATRLVPVRQTILDGLPVTVYRLTPSGRSCGISTSLFDAEVWVDGQSRLVRAQMRWSYRVSPLELKQLKGLPRSFIKNFVGAPITLRTTIRLFDFGAPVAIARPKHIVSPPANVFAQSISGKSTAINQTLHPGRCRK